MPGILESEKTQGEKMKKKNNIRSRIIKILLLVMLTCAVTVGNVPVMSAVETQAAVKSKRTRIQLPDGSGRYLLNVGKNGYLKDKTGKKITGFQYIKMPKGKTLKSGYYVFNSKGCLCQKKHFHKVDAVISGKTFKGTYYFGGSNGSLYRKAGWRKINGKKYCLSSYGKRYENCWKSGYYLKADGTIAVSQKLADGTYVDCDGRRCSEQDMTLNRLKSQLRKMINGYSGSWSVYVKNLETGAVINLNDKSMYPASTIKAFVMASTFDQINKDKLSYNSTIKNLLREMITVSDNEAYNQLVRYNSKNRSFTKGAAVVNKYLRANGYTKTECHHTLHPASSAYAGDGKRNLASARDCGVLLEKIYNGTCVSAKYSKEMKNLLLKQTRRWKIPAGIPSGIKVANKTGETSSVQHDMALVYGKKTDYVICVFSNTGSEGYSVPRIKDISRTVYKYLNK